MPPEQDDPPVSPTRRVAAPARLTATAAERRAVQEREAELARTTALGHDDEQEADVPDDGTRAQAVDPTALQSLVSRMGERGPAMLARLLDTWEGETAKRLGELQAAVEAQDAEAVGRVAHAIRGGSAAMGALGLADVCGDVEGQARRGEQVDLPQAQTRIREAVEQARTGLAQLRVGSAG